MVVPKFPMIVIVGPTAVGKTTIIKAVLNIFPEIRTSVTYTTRAPRQTTGPEDKIMHHVSTEEFLARQAKGEFIESAIVHGHWYGTHAEETEKLLEHHPVLFNLDIQGMEQLTSLYQDRVVSIFIAPESLAVIIERLKGRGESDEQDAEERLRSAEWELKRQNICDYVIVNKEGKIQETIENVAAIIRDRLALDRPR